MVTANVILLFLGHEDRVLNLISNPDCSAVASVAGDETVRLWKCFELDPVKKKNKDRVTKSTTGVLGVPHHAIR